MIISLRHIRKEAAMQTLELPRTPDAIQDVALKAFGRIAEAWSLTLREAALLADMSESTWKRARKPGFAGDLTRDQTPRISALVGLYKSLELYFDPPLSLQWVTLPNRGPEFDGARPVDSMIAGGLPKILRVRNYVDAIRGGL
jgi:hypothetical protein